MNKTMDKMKRIFKEMNGHIVKFGDKVLFSYGDIESSATIEVNDANINFLLESKILTEVDTLTPTEVLFQIGSSNGMKFGETVEFLNKTLKLSELAFYNIVLKKISDIKEDKYSSDITDSDILWGVNSCTKIPFALSFLPNGHKKAALFRSFEDALKASQLADNIREKIKYFGTGVEQED